MNTIGFPSSIGSLTSLNERVSPLFQSTGSSHLQDGLSALRSGLSVNLAAGESSGRQVFSKSIEFSLGIKTEPSYEFTIPSPQDVASTVLGFVENRINMERQSGASDEKLNNLMAQARSGIEKGYTQAEQDIKDLGLMTDELAEDISTGYNLITDGLARIDKTIQIPDVKSDAVAPAVNSPQQTVVNARSVERVFAQSNAPATDDVTATENKYISLTQITESSADFVLNTREGDQILIRMADIQAMGYAEDNENVALDASQMSYFEFSVKGDLNEDELRAINHVLEQVGDISSAFFNDQFEEAFNSALSLGFDSEQIASFSLDLSKMQVQEVRTYDEGSKPAVDSYKRHQPLVNIAQQFEKLDTLLAPLSRFEELHAMVESFVAKAIDVHVVDREQDMAGNESTIEHYQQFSHALMSRIIADNEA